MGRPSQLVKWVCPKVVAWVQTLVRQILAVTGPIIVPHSPLNFTVYTSFGPPFQRAKVELNLVNPT
jgi:predicted alpha/beta hydrolase family esterase